eukprot:1140913-Pelagomonas_calceolata.AAC.10
MPCSVHTEGKHFDPAPWVQRLRDLGSECGWKKVWAIKIVHPHSGGLCVSALGTLKLFAQFTLPGWSCVAPCLFVTSHTEEYLRGGGSTPEGVS